MSARHEAIREQIRALQKIVCNRDTLTSADLARLFAGTLDAMFDMLSEIESLDDGEASS